VILPWKPYVEEFAQTTTPTAMRTPPPPPEKRMNATPSPGSLGEGAWDRGWTDEQVQVARKVDNANHRINHYSADSIV